MGVGEGKYVPASVIMQYVDARRLTDPATRRKRTRSRLVAAMHAGVADKAIYNEHYLYAEHHGSKLYNDEDEDENNDELSLMEINAKGDGVSTSYISDRKVKQVIDLVT